MVGTLLMLICLIFGLVFRFDPEARAPRREIDGRGTRR
jgi:cbb3-type cytochrome oxidase subunit 3